MSWRRGIFVHAVVLGSVSLGTLHAQHPGAAIFAANCAGCHGADGRGERLVVEHPVLEQVADPAGLVGQQFAGVQLLHVLGQDQDGQPGDPAAGLQGGAQAGKLMCAAIPGHVGTIAIIDEPEVTSVQDRVKGFKQAIAANCSGVSHW